MRTEIRIPTDQYAYVSVFLEDATPQEIKQKYDEVKAVMAGQTVPDNTFNEYLVKLIDEDLSSKKAWGSPEQYALLNKPQQDVVQALKRFLKRLNYQTKQL